MTHKNSILIIAGVVLLVASLAFAAHDQLAGGLFRIGTKSNSNVPESVIYDNLFRTVVELKKRSVSGEIDTNKSLAHSTFIQSYGDLTDADYRILEDTAIAYVKEVSLIDEQAKAMIDQTRQKFANGIVPRNSPVPPELIKLQNERNAMALTYRDRLRDALGAERFVEVEKFIVEKWGGKIKQVRLSDVKLEEVQ
ncbi:MAG TPA: hypothetical protein PKC65_07370 [Pyrinomonadaceae bacterium]|nr:hypothetical protein [Pyrinomonadaceae bacterium]